MDSVLSSLEFALASRRDLFDARHEEAFRLFNGFTEGNPDLVIDVYGHTLLIHDYADEPSLNQEMVREVREYFHNALGWLQAGIVKTRNGKTQEEKRGRLIFGEKPDRRIKEFGLWYAIDLTMNRDASLYLDTRNLRRWLMTNSKGKTVLNTFAYTGSLGVAAMSGGASRVVQLDLNRGFLNLAKESYTLNGFPIHKSDFIAGDFFPVVGKFKRANETFDCVLIDPPFFSATSKGRVDQENEGARLINKVRPLIKDGGYLVAINNALYTSGSEYYRTLEELCTDGYLKIRELVPVPEDFTGYPETRRGKPITDPAPFNHSTKIAILDVKRK
jgi:23S rRNA (cytosine1962-C5)-methyltransferase